MEQVPHLSGAETGALLPAESARQHARRGQIQGVGKFAGSSAINVCQEIARVARVGARSVSNVKTIREIAHPRLKEALRDGTLTINRALQFCKLPRAEQLEQFIRYSEERATNKVIRRTIARPKEEKASLNVVAVLDDLRRQEVRQPGSVEVRVGRHNRTIVLISQDLSAEPRSQEDLKLT